MTHRHSPAEHYQPAHPLFWQAHYRDDILNAELVAAHCAQRKDSPLRSAMWSAAYALLVKAKEDAMHARESGVLLTLFVDRPIPRGVFLTRG